MAEFRTYETVTEFLQSLLSDETIAPYLRKIYVLCPQISPLQGEGFFSQTAQQASMAEERLRGLAEKIDLSNGARAQRVVRFNDLLAAQLVLLPMVEVLRVDRAMLGSDGAVDPRFIGADPTDHHANFDETRKLWFRFIAPLIEDHQLVG